MTYPVRDYCIRIRLLSPVGTPWQSDTIFGHLAWHVAYGWRGIGIQEFLRPFLEGQPPFVLSDAFPEGFLPRPFLPVRSKRPTQLKEYAEAKRREKATFVSLDDFEAIRRGHVDKWQPAPELWHRFDVLHASINRLTNTTTGPEGERATEGHLFSTRLSLPASTDSDSPQVLPLCVYLRAGDPWGAWVPEMLQDMAPLGFGSDRSTGVGAYEVIGVEPFDGFGPLDGANGFISLSSYCPARTDPTRGRWKIRIKYGKLGENAGDGNPFKRPLIQFEPGAVFLTDGPPKPFYGRTVTGIAPRFPDAIQCCYTLAVPCILPEAVMEAFQQ